MPECVECPLAVPQKRTAKGLDTCSRACAKARNQRAWKERTDRLRYLRGPHSPLSPEARRQLPRR